MKKKISLDAISLLFITLLLMSALALSPIRPVDAQADSMTFTSGKTIDFSSTTEMSFWSGVTMRFGTGLRMQFIEVLPDGFLEPCDLVQVIWPIGFIPPECTWWEILDASGAPTGFEFHVDGFMPPDIFHIDDMWPGPFQFIPGQVIDAELKINYIEPCDYFVVHWPVGWWPAPCTWWEIIDPETGQATGYEFHVDWTNESCEFHIDKIVPGPYFLPWWYYEVEARQKISTIVPCDWLIIVDPPGFLPEVCSWWEILDPLGNPTGLEFHVDETLNDMFHVDAVVPDPLEIPPPPAYPTRAREKIDIIQQGGWYRVADPATTPETCSWWKVISPDTGGIDIEFHVDVSDPGLGTFHLDYSDQTTPFTPPTPHVIAERKIDTIQPCDWFKVIDPTGFVPEICSWWVITSPPEWAGTKFHVDDSDGSSMFHIDNVDGQVPPIEFPPWNVTVEEYTPPDPWYWKPSYDDYAPSGMPDFDQRQGGTYQWVDQFAAWSHCGPVAVANSLWWLDSQFEPNPVPPPVINDGFPLVKAYGQWDDHDPQNVPWLVEHLAWLMDTDGRRTTVIHSGTDVNDMQAGLTQYLSWSGVNPLGDVNGDGIVDQTDEMIVINAMGSHPGDPTWNLAADIFPATVSYPPVTDNVIDTSDLDLVSMNMGLIGLFYEHTVAQPSFDYIEQEVEKCQDVVLLLGYWFWDEGAGGWYRESGHYVTVAGVNSLESKIAISDPMEDAFENGLIPEGRVPVPHVHMPPEPPYVTHNDAAFVSQDIYDVIPISPPFPPCPGGNLSLLNYVNWQPTPPFFTVIEYAVVTSQLANPDIAVTNVTTGKSGCKPYPTLCKNFTTWVNVTVENQGPFNETVTVTAYANATVIGIQTISNMLSGTTTILKFLWSSATFAYGNYTISAYATPVPAESELSDNTFVDGIVGVTLPGDATGDWKVGPPDFAYLSAAYGSTPGTPAWNPNPDFDCNEKVGPSDFAYLSAFYGQHYP
jgi:hypothetical protein